MGYGWSLFRRRCPAVKQREIDRTAFPDPRLWLSEANDTVRPAEMSGSEHRRSAPVSAEAMPGMTDEEYIQAAEFFRSVLAIGAPKGRLTDPVQELAWARTQPCETRSRRTERELGDQLDRSENRSRAK